MGSEPQRLPLIPAILLTPHVCPEAQGPGEPALSTEAGTFPRGEVRVVEIVLVEMEAAHEVVGGLGEGTLCQDVSEELGDPASYGRWFCYLQMGDLLFVCTGERRGEAMRVALGKRPLTLYPSLCGDPEGKQLTSTCLRHSQLAAHLSYRKAQAPTQVGLILGPAVPELAGFGGPVQAVLEAGRKQIAPDT